MAKRQNGLHTTHVLPQLKTNLLRQSIQIIHIGKTYISRQLYCCDV